MRRQSVHRVRLRKPKRLPFLLARVSRTDGQRAYVCSGCRRWSRRVGPAGARRACRRLDGAQRPRRRLNRGSLSGTTSRGLATSPAGPLRTFGAVWRDGTMLVVMHEDQLAIDNKIVRRLIDEQLPQWRSLAVRQVSATGTVNAIFRMGNDLPPGSRCVRRTRAECVTCCTPRRRRCGNWLPRPPCLRPGQLRSVSPD